MTVTTTNSRHLLIKLAAGARLPDEIRNRLRDEVVVAGWLRANGILEDVELSVGGKTRKIAGTLHAISIEGSIGLENGDVTCGLRAVLARETDTGHETLAGEIVSARVTALEALATAFDDVTATRKNGTLDTLTVSAAPSSPALPAPAPAPAPAPVAAPPPPAPSAPSVPAPAPSEPSAPPPPKPSPTFSAPTALPMKPFKPAAAAAEEEQPYPDAGDVVEHFAFGRCEVVKSDGDRLHIRLGKDGRIKEVALEMLRVTPLPPVEGATGKHFKLDRKL